MSLSLSVYRAMIGFSCLWFKVSRWQHFPIAECIDRYSVDSLYAALHLDCSRAFSYDWTLSLTSSHIVCVTTNFIFCLSFYEFSKFILKDKEKAFYAFFSWFSPAHFHGFGYYPCYLSPLIIWDFLANILKGTLKLAIPTHIKESVTYIVYNYWDMRLRTPGFAYFRFALMLALLSTTIILKAQDSG